MCLHFRNTSPKQRENSWELLLSHKTLIEELFEHVKVSCSPLSSNKFAQKWAFAEYVLQKVRFEKKEYDIMKKFEAIHHPDIWKWIIDKVVHFSENTVTDGITSIYLNIQNQIARAFSVELLMLLSIDEDFFFLRGRTPLTNFKF